MKRRNKVIKFPENVHQIQFNVTLRNQSSDDVAKYADKIQNLVMCRFPAGTTGEYRVNEIKRKGRKD